MCTGPAPCSAVETLWSPCELGLPAAHSPTCWAGGGQPSGVTDARRNRGVPPSSGKCAPVSTHTRGGYGFRGSLTPDKTALSGRVHHGGVCWIFKFFPPFLRCKKHRDEHLRADAFRLSFRLFMGSVSEDDLGGRGCVQGSIHVASALPGEGVGAATGCRSGPHGGPGILHPTPTGPPDWPG